MKEIIAQLRPAVMATIVLALVCCGVYPAAVFAVAQVAFHDKANGSLIVDQAGTIRGSKLLGQNFTQEKYFHPRPSAAGNGYDAANSGGSNFGPTSQKLRDAIAERIKDYRAQNQLAPGDAIPADAVTASGSGLDPHISLANAKIQVARVAAARSLQVDEINRLIEQNTNQRDLSLFGEPGVNVLTLNLALDARDVQGRRASK